MPYKRKRTSTSYKSKKYRRATPYRRKTGIQRVARKATISRIARQVVLASAESKEKSVNQGKVELYHNSLSLVANLNGETSTYMPGQGSGDTQRNGDRIIARGFKIHCLCGQKADRQNVTWRVLVIAQKSNSAVLTYNQLFKNISGNGMLDEVNDDQVTVLYQKYWKPNKSTTFTANAGVENTQEFTFTKRIFIPRKKMYKFDEDGGFTHNDKRLYMYMIPYDAWGTFITDNICYVQTWTKFLYKDP